METKTTIIDAIDRGYFKTPSLTPPFVELPSNSTFQDIKNQVATNNIIGFQHKLKIAGRCVIAEIKFTWKGNVAKTAYLHIYRINNFEECKVIEHWKEQKDGSFKTI